MKERKGLIAIIMTVVLLLGGLVYTLSNNHQPSGQKATEKTFEEQISDKRKELKESRGLYCPDTIVLANTTKEKAESLARKLGARVRLTKREDYATLYLPEGTTIEDVYANEEYEADLLNMTPDYTVRTMAVDAL